MWGIEFKADIFISREDFGENINQVEFEIQYCENKIIESHRILCMYAATSPSEIIPEEWKDQAITYIHNKIDEEVAQIIETSQKLVKLNLYLEYLKEKS
jgi:hypothetical protein